MEYYNGKEFTTKKAMFDFIVANKDTLKAQKKAIMKKADAFISQPTIVIDHKKEATKADNNIIDPINKESLKVIVAINTTNYLDSHGDVHIPGIWNKSLLDNKMIMHIQEHEMEFDKIISDADKLKAYTKNYSWSELGYNYEGNTEALVFESTIERKRNEFMLNQYANGWVRNHSVGMYYVKLDFAINDEDYPNEFEAWNKYYPQIANKEVADERGCFWYVLEAKCIEGSAVPLGSNSATPTLEVKNDNVICQNCGNTFDYLSIKESGMGYVLCPECNEPVTQAMKSEPEKSTRHNIEPEKSTQKGIDYNYLTNNLKIQ